MMQRAFKQVDVFTSKRYFGNPLAVVLDGTGLSSEEMQHFTHWTNLSEAVFLLPPTDEGRAAGADYRVRIFTPETELAFAGHPTLGSCHAWLESGAQPQRADIVVQECGAGLVKIRRRGKQLAFAAPESRREAPSPAHLARVVQALGLQLAQIRYAQTLDNGPIFITLLLSSRQDVLACQPNLQALKDLRTCAALVSVEETVSNPHVEVRAFGPHLGFDEDPVTGSLNASVAQWLIDAGIAPPASRVLMAR